jgi:hypothetical protein
MNHERKTEEFTFFLYESVSRADIANTVNMKTLTLRLCHKFLDLFHMFRKYDEVLIRSLWIGGYQSREQP